MHSPLQQKNTKTKKEPMKTAIVFILLLVASVLAIEADMEPESMSVDSVKTEQAPSVSAESEAEVSVSSEEEQDDEDIPLGSHAEKQEEILTSQGAPEDVQDIPDWDSEFIPEIVEEPQVTTRIIGDVVTHDDFVKVDEAHYEHITVHKMPTNLLDEDDPLAQVTDLWETHLNNAQKAAGEQVQDEGLVGKVKPTNTILNPSGPGLTKEEMGEFRATKEFMERYNFHKGTLFATNDGLFEVVNSPTYILDGSAAMFHTTRVGMLRVIKHAEWEHKVSHMVPQQTTDAETGEVEDHEVQGDMREALIQRAQEMKETHAKVANDEAVNAAFDKLQEIMENSNKVMGARIGDAPAVHEAWYKFQKNAIQDTINRVREETLEDVNSEDSSEEDSDFSANDSEATEDEDEQEENSSVAQNNEDEQIEDSDFWRRRSFRRVGRAFRRVARRVKRVARRVVRKVGRAVKRVVRKVAKGISKAVKAIAKKVGKFFKKLAAGFKKFVAVIKKFVKVAFKVVKGMLKKMINSVMTIIKMLTGLIEWDKSKKFYYNGKTITNKTILRKTIPFKGGSGSLDVTLKEGKFGFGAGFTFYGKIKFFKLKKFKASVGGSMTFVLKVLARIKGEFSKGKDKKMFSTIMKTWKFMIGPVPVVITCRLELYAGFNAKLNAAVVLNTGVELRAELEAGVEYRGGKFRGIWKRIWKQKFYKPKLAACTNIMFEMFLRPQIAVLLYDIAGPTVALEPYLRFELLGNGSKQCNKKGNVQDAIEAAPGQFAQDLDAVNSSDSEDDDLKAADFADDVDDSSSEDDEQAEEMDDAQSEVSDNDAFFWRRAAPANAFPSYWVVKFGLRGKVGVKFQLFGKDLANYSTKIFDKAWKIADGCLFTGCNAEANKWAMEPTPAPSGFTKLAKGLASAKDFSSFKQAAGKMAKNYAKNYAKNKVAELKKKYNVDAIVGTLKGKLKTEIAKKINEVKSKIGNYKAQFEKAKQMVKKYGSRGGWKKKLAALKSKIGGFKGKLSKYKGRLGKVGKDLKAAFKNRKFGGFLKKYGKKFKGFSAKFKKFAGKFKKGFGKAKNFFGKAKKFVRKFKGKFGKVKKFAGKAYEAIKKGGSSGASGVDSAVSAALANLAKLNGNGNGAAASSGNTGASTGFTGGVSPVFPQRPVYSYGGGFSRGCGRCGGCGGCGCNRGCGCARAVPQQQVQDAAVESDADEESEDEDEEVSDDDEDNELFEEPEVTEADVKYFITDMIPTVDEWEVDSIPSENLVIPSYEEVEGEDSNDSEESSDSEESGDDQDEDEEKLADQDDEDSETDVEDADFWRRRRFRVRRVVRRVRRVVRRVRRVVRKPRRIIRRVVRRVRRVTRRVVRRVPIVRRVVRRVRRIVRKPIFRKIRRVVRRVRRVVRKPRRVVRRAVRKVVRRRFSVRRATRKVKKAAKSYKKTASKYIDYRKNLSKDDRRAMDMVRNGANHAELKRLKSLRTNAERLNKEADKTIRDTKRYKLDKTTKGKRLLVKAAESKKYAKKVFLRDEKARLKLKQINAKYAAQANKKYLASKNAPKKKPAPKRRVVRKVIRRFTRKVVRRAKRVVRRRSRRRRRRW
eukprot:TRINITY_DN2808_c0_g1_i1.p1 TRINITY_DN2808_c0_g1~~TRINITY_DN2808_c0_g1_i1.p1  ORF type:complete len:1602 (-),score=728.15 TRINITY_DN2808_c0_g1_i1:797-5557(-)